MANASHTPTLIMIMNITKLYLEKHKYLNYLYVNLIYEHITCAQLTLLVTKISFCIGRVRIDLSARISLTDLTKPSEDRLTSIILASFQCDLWHCSSTIKTMSSTFKFSLMMFHLTRDWSLCTISFLQRVQNKSIKYWALRHRRKAYKSSRLDDWTGCVKTLDFMVSKWLGVSGS